MERALIIDPRDHLAVALQDLEVGATVLDVPIIQGIPAKQKFALRDLEVGETVTMYGVSVGKPILPIKRGGLISTANLEHVADDYSLDDRSVFEWTPPDVSAWESRTFDGYHRQNGTVGTQNHWVVVPLVFCENRNLEVMREALLAAIGLNKSDHYERYAEAIAAKVRAGKSITEFEIPEGGAAKDRLFQNVDGVKFLLHGLGCGGTTDDARALCALIAGYIAHPNVAGATILSLGCQHAQVDMLREELDRRNNDRPVLVFEQQKWASEKKMLEAALRDTFSALVEANKNTRSPAPLSKLVLGVECGGSDGFSGISANPTIGAVSDQLVALNGTVILSEFPELCGVEQELVNRCVSDEVASRYAQLMRDYSAAAEAVGASFKDNPSPGNIRDGLITDAIKSAGAAKKGGTSPVTAALDYTEPANKPGLVLLSTPGNDVESTTAMAGSGATLILFSTGLGTPTGNAITPVIKIATNTDLATRLSDIIDFDTGPVITGEATPDTLSQDLIAMIIEVASGRAHTRAQQLGQDDFLPWKRGVSL